MEPWRFTLEPSRFHYNLGGLPMSTIATLLCYLAQWGSILELLRPTLDPWRPTLEPWRLTLELWGLTPNPGGLEAHPGDVEAHPGAVEAHPGAVEGTRGSLEALEDVSSSNCFLKP
jgi:hypothetical protein